MRIVLFSPLGGDVPFFSPSPLSACVSVIVSPPGYDTFFASRPQFGSSLVFLLLASSRFFLLANLAPSNSVTLDFSCPPEPGSSFMGFEFRFLALVFLPFRGVQKFGIFDVVWGVPIFTYDYCFNLIPFQQPAGYDRWAFPFPLSPPLSLLLCCLMSFRCPPFRNRISFFFFVEMTPIPPPPAKFRPVPT